MPLPTSAAGFIWGALRNNGFVSEHLFHRAKGITGSAAIFAYDPVRIGVWKAETIASAFAAGQVDHTAHGLTSNIKRPAKQGRLLRRD